MTHYDCIIRGGTVAHHDRTERADVGIRGETIACVGDLTDARAEREIFAAGKIVLPGGIDPHTHIASPYGGLCGGDTVLSATLAAAFGGTTCVIDFASGENDLPARTSQRIRFFSEGAPVVDFGVHCVINPADADRIAQLPDVAALGVCSLKYYMNNVDPSSDGLLLHLLERADRAAALVCVHAENEQIARFRTAALLREGRTGWEYFPQSRPEICETEAVGRAMTLAAAAGTGIYFVHISAGASAAQIRNARANGAPVYAETCAHYLTLSDAVYARADGELYQCAPPLRSSIDNELLWAALRDGTLQTLGSDHVSYTTQEKRRALQRNASDRLERDFSRVPGGLAGIEVRLATLINGVLDGRLSLPELVCVNSYYPARLFGLYPRLGEIAEGFDASLAILDPARTCEVRDSASLHMRCDHTPYAGMRYRCLPETVLVRGRAVIQNGVFTGAAQGRFLHRALDAALLQDNRALTEKSIKPD